MARNTANKQPTVYCPLCESRIKFHGDIDFNKFNGQVCCDKCETLVAIIVSKNKLQGLKVITKGFRKLSSTELIRLNAQLEEYKKDIESRQSEELKELEKQFSKTLTSDSGTPQTVKEYKKWENEYKKKSKSDSKKART